MTDTNYEKVEELLAELKLLRCDDQAGVSVIHHDLIKMYCEELGLDYKTFLLLVSGENGMACMNWEKLWHTSEEKEMSLETAKEKLYYDWFYMYDRMYEVRLIRAHWNFVIYNEKYHEMLNLKDGN